MKKTDFQIQKSDTFIRQAGDFVLHYQHDAGIKIADKFIDSIKDALFFVSKNPYACPIYNLDRFYDLRKHQLRKWNLQDFPHKILFRIVDKNTIRIDAIYAHKMNVTSRTPKDI